VDVPDLDTAQRELDSAETVWDGLDTCPGCDGLLKLAHVHVHSGIPLVSL
jgi:hypothetical protein